MKNLCATFGSNSTALTLHTTFTGCNERQALHNYSYNSVRYHF